DDVVVEVVDGALARLERALEPDAIGHVTAERHAVGPRRLDRRAICGRAQALLDLDQVEAGLPLFEHALPRGLRVRRALSAELRAGQEHARPDQLAGIDAAAQLEL